MTTLRAAAAAGLRHASCWAGGRVAVASSPRRRGARNFLKRMAIAAVQAAVIVLALFFAVFVGCGSTGFHNYRACNEQPGTIQHDPGEVLAEFLGDDGLTHYTFLSDRWKNDDRRNTVELTRVNRACPLVTGMTAGGVPVGSVWDLSGRNPNNKR